jgi:hypothetical protein
MKILRSVTRRGFSVGTAGWFAILKPNTWFPASRLPGTFRYRSSQSAGTTAIDHAGRLQTTIPPRIMIPSTPDRRLLRPALVLLAAMAITSALLWWIMHP